MEGYIKANYKQQSTTVITNGDVDLNYIISEDGFAGSNSNYCYTRTIVYLYNNRKLDKDIILNFIKQGFLKMDERNNLCFITYNDALTKGDIIAITRKGTYKADYKNNLVKEHHTGFFYAKKGFLETNDFEIVYVFESCVDLMSFLTLIKVTFNLDCWDLYSEINNDDDLGEYFIHELQAIEIPDNIIVYFNFVRYGRDIYLSSWSGSYTPYGCLCQTDRIKF